MFVINLTRSYLVALGVILLPPMLAVNINAAELIVENGVLQGATDVDVEGKPYDVQFMDGTCMQLYDGCNHASDFPFESEAEALAASEALENQVLIDTTEGDFDSIIDLTRGCSGYSSDCWIHTPFAPGEPTHGGGMTANLVTFKNYEDEYEGHDEQVIQHGHPIDTRHGLVNDVYTVWRPAETEPEPLVDLAGDVETEDGVGVCAMVLASGQYMFSCSPNGPYALNNLQRETNGSVKHQIYAQGFFPRIDMLPGSTVETVVMERSGTCPSYNLPYNPDTFPDSAGKRHSISGRVLLQSTDMPICAMVLANGAHIFSCDGSGKYSLEFPLDSNGQFKLQVYANGFAPTIQSFDDFSLGGDVRMARSAECR